MDLQQLKKSLFADGAISETDTALLRETLLDGGIDKEKAEFLFEIKDSVSRKKIHKDLENLFVEAISSFLLEDEDSPGEIDDNEAKWLRAKIQYKGFADDIDKKLLANLRRKSINFPKMLNYKNKYVRGFEVFLFSLRFVTFTAVLGSMIASVILFITSSMQVIKGMQDFFHYFGEDKTGNLEHLVATFVASIDGYLFATVLIIFSMGVYELFINKIDPVNKVLDSRPSWLQISSIDDLKSSLGKVILMILIVSFFEHSLNIHYESVSDLLFLGIGILLISAALFLTHVHGGHKHNEPEH
ncbi:MAG: YqhA family protein [Dysgonamonadaceae bacterium]|nr:YqhA family protein [Dysgonamonadaceae bacterium]